MILDPVPPRSSLIQALERKRARAAAVDLNDLALLRRTLPRLPGPMDARALALVAGQCGASCAAQDAGLLTACLWASRHRGAVPVDSDWNLGRALRATPRDEGERLWRSLCTANETSLARRMSAAVEVLAAHGVATDWHRLHRDLRSWHQGFHHLVLRRWCTGLFGHLSEGPPPAGRPSDDIVAQAVRPSTSKTSEVSP